MIKKIFFLATATIAGYVSNGQPAEPSQNKVGYASVEYIISKLPDLKEIESEMKSTQTQLRNQIQAKSQAVQKQYTDFNTNMKTMSDTVRVKSQQELEQAMGELEKMQQDAQQALQNKHKLFMAPIYLKVNKAIQEVAKENGFDIILTDKVSGYNFLLFQSSQLDISNLVLQKFGVTPPAK